MEQSELIEKINLLRKEKNAVIMAHYYQEGAIQDIADMIGDSLALAQWATKTTADILVVCGVHFMGETAKILSPHKKVLVPDMNAGCSLADSCKAKDFEAFIKQHPGHTVISYVNTTAAVKALTDVVVTSTNARKIVDQFPQDAKLIFGPDRNLGDYINKISGRNMVLWNGACHVHEQFSVEQLVSLKKQYPEAKVLAHPECKNVVLMLADYIGSTQALLKRNPNKTFIPIPPVDSTCGCNNCQYMRLNTLEKIYDCLKNETPEILVDEAIRVKAVKPILKMLEMSK